MGMHIYKYCTSTFYYTSLDSLEMVWMQDSNIFAILTIGDYLLSFICTFSFLLYYLNGSSVPMVVVTSLLAFRVLRFISTIVRVFWSAMNKNVKKLKGGQTLMGLIHYH